MKLTKKILLLSSVMLLGATTMFGATKSINPAKAENEEETVLPSSITSSIYRYAHAIGDAPAYVDDALITWLNATDNISSLPFFNEDPVEFTAAVNRKTKDNFYVLAYYQQYLTNATSSARYPIDVIRFTLDNLMPTKDAFIGFIDFEINNEYEDAYYSCKEFYLALYEASLEIENNVFSVHFNAIEEMVTKAKNSLKTQIDNMNDFGLDQTVNNYLFFMKNALNGFASLVSRDTLSADKYTTHLLDTILFGPNTHIDTYFSSEFVDFTLDDYLIAVSEIYEPIELEEISAPYIEKLNLQLATYLITYNFATVYNNTADAIKNFINNCGPLMYKLLDFCEAKRDNDCPNIVILSFQIMEDMQALFELLGLNTNKQDLKYEKYLANMRLGSLVYNSDSIDKFYKFLLNVNNINKVSLTEFSYQDGVTEINRLLLKGYKDVNVDIIPTSDQAVLFFAEGLEALASRTQGYSFEIRKMLNHDHAFPIESKLQEDYGDNLLYVNIIWIDMVLTDTNTNQEILSIDNPIAVTFGIYNLQINTDIKIYRYDEVNDKVVTLSNEDTPSHTDYFDVVIDDVTVHTKDFGTFAIVYINRLVKEEVETFRQDIINLKAEVERLTLDNLAKDKKIAELEAEILELESRIDALERDNYIKAMVIDNLRKGLNDVKELLNEKINQVSKLEEIIEGLNQEIKDLKAEVSALTIDNLAKDNIIAGLQARISELESKINTLELDVENKQSIIDSLNKELNEVKASLNEKINEANKLQKEVNSKNTLCVIFIILTCLFAITTVGMTISFLAKKKGSKK